MGKAESGWHRGKGSRRAPPSTSLGNRRHVAWRKIALHNAEKTTLTAPIEYIFTIGPGKKIETAIYLLDQQAAHHDLAYSLENVSGSSTYGWTILTAIPEKKLQVAKQISEALNPPTFREPIKFRTEFWTELIRPDDPKVAGWYAAIYQEYASQRDDGSNYIAFLFRDEQRLRFGIKEFLGRTVSEMNWSFGKWRKYALDFLKNPVLRNAHLSDDQDLPKMWRRH